MYTHYSEIALQIYVAQKMGIIKSRADFYKRCYPLENFYAIIEENKNLFKQGYETLSQQLSQNQDNDTFSNKGMICVYDEDFPNISSKIYRNSDKPYLFFYEGNISLISSKNNNIAVIGTRKADNSIAKREKKIVDMLIKHNICVVSGLALGCDSIAQKECVVYSNPTVSTLPATLDNIYPSQNISLANDIVKENGLLVTEYDDEPKNNYEAKGRFIERDRLQTLFSRAVILIASEEDGGSRHAVDYAFQWNVPVYVVYNNAIDNTNNLFTLNKKLVEENKVEILTPANLKRLCENHYIPIDDNMADIENNIEFYEELFS